MSHPSLIVDKLIYPMREYISNCEEEGTCVSSSILSLNDTYDMYVNDKLLFPNELLFSYDTRQGTISYMMAPEGSIYILSVIIRKRDRRRGLFTKLLKYIMNDGKI